MANIEDSNTQKTSPIHHLHELLLRLFAVNAEAYAKTSVINVWADLLVIRSSKSDSIKVDPLDWLHIANPMQDVLSTFDEARAICLALQKPLRVIAAEPIEVFEKLIYSMASSETIADSWGHFLDEIAKENKLAQYLKSQVETKNGNEPNTLPGEPTNSSLKDFPYWIEEKFSITKSLIEVSNLNTAEPTKDAVISLLEQATALIKDVLEADLPEDLKAFLIETLKLFENSLIGYEIYGDKRLKKALKEAIGNTLLFKIAKNSQGMDDKSSEIMKRFERLIEATANIVTTVQGVTQFLLPGRVP